MKEYLETFQRTIQFAEQLSNGQIHALESTEMKKISSSLQGSIMPCIVEIKASSSRLRESLEVCFKSLEIADDILQSKQRISDVSGVEIWQQLEHLSCCYIKVQSTANSYKEFALQKTNKAWLREFETLKNKYFISENGELKNSIGWDKKRFTSDVCSALFRHNHELEKATICGLRSILYIVESFDVAMLEKHLSSLDLKAYEFKKLEIKRVLENLKRRCQDTKNLPVNFTYLSLQSQFYSTTEDWKNRWGDIGWKYVSRFNEKVLMEGEKRINALFDDRTKLATDFLDQVITFYNHFLELQKTYQNESLVQRTAEKTWINMQRKEFEKIQAEIDLILGK
ncbi:hypothetical protein C7B61_13885 [filamentous cyanobacterium CCP1]|nr:hypothetical protein C7B76_30165 [filamentous cyanobacterium CCP2]PSB63002.1 hypothetical protein C7B61_13885 [filamentous cyanobacterium CCP1]